jgi:hypothetical protein
MRFAVGFFAGAFVLWAGSFADFPAPSATHRAIDYLKRPQDPIDNLSVKLADGSVKLQWSERGGYLASVLAALNIPVESQMMVFSKTSLQVPLIEPKNPRSIFFNDSVAVAWMHGGFIEIVSQDPVAGAMFYTLEQKSTTKPVFQRMMSCLGCHQAQATLDVPGMFTRSGATGTAGEALLIYGNTFVDHRTPIEERWGGWYATGGPAGLKHMGNAMVVDRDNPEMVNATPVASLAGRFPVERYLSDKSDVTAMLVFAHQTHMTNLITRLGWEARAGSKAQVIEEGAKELVDYMLFVDEAPLSAKVARSAYAAKFESQGPRDSKGRSLRQLNLQTRVFEYPCSYLIYSDGFKALPAVAKDAVYRRMRNVIGANARYRAVAEILRETAPEVLR